MKPNERGSEVDCGEEVACGPLISGSDRAKLLELGEEVLDQMAHCIEMAMKSLGSLRLAFGGITAVLPAQPAAR